MNRVTIFAVLFFGAGVLATPVSQPTGQHQLPTRYITATGLQLQRPSPAQARVAQAIYEGQSFGGQSTAPQSFQAQVPQNVLGSSVDRQVQRIAQVSGPQYVQQIQALQTQAQLTEAQTVALRRQQGTATLPQRLQQQAQIEAQVAAQRQQQAQPQPQYRLVQAQPQAQPQQQVQYVSRQPQIQYVQRQQAPSRQPQPIQEEEPEQIDANTSYQFGFDVKDDLYTNYQNRKESKDGDKISGSYSVVDSDGYIRTVTYTADPKEGFKADVQRRPTDIVVKVPVPQSQYQRQQQQQQQPQQQYIQQEPTPVRSQGQKQRIVYQYQPEQEQ